MRTLVAPARRRKASFPLDCWLERRLSLLGEHPWFLSNVPVARLTEDPSRSRHRLGSLNESAAMLHDVRACVRHV